MMRKDLKLIILILGIFLVISLALNTVLAQPQFFGPVFSFCRSLDYVIANIQEYKAYGSQGINLTIQDRECFNFAPPGVMASWVELLSESECITRDNKVVGIWSIRFQPDGPLLYAARVSGPCEAKEV
jgi:hypothetical protein